MCVLVMHENEETLCIHIKIIFINNGNVSFKIVITIEFIKIHIELHFCSFTIGVINKEL